MDMYGTHKASRVYMSCLEMVDWGLIWSQVNVLPFELNLRASTFKPDLSRFIRCVAIPRPHSLSKPKHIHHIIVQYRRDDQNHSVSSHYEFIIIFVHLVTVI